ncbi:tail completion protein gp17 [Sphingomonas xinjiangensis]|uniref:tail completion protein gp17 n=1 Tax=Sphingomonas xinjiangensis TaxID=643568 RepID=UPI001FE98158|nr:DUF3168 domain-containing protein [Sphingomonas xinjiangensis]
MGLQYHARRALLTRLRRDPLLTSLVEKAGIYSQKVPAPERRLSPFIKTGVPQTLPRTATCLNGANINLPVDAFAGPRKSGTTVLEEAEDHAERIGMAIEGALHLQGETVDVDGHPLRLTYRLTDIRLFPDGAELDVFHYSCLVNVRAVAE